MPAAIKRRLRETRGKPPKIEHFRSLPYKEVPAFVVTLRADEGIAPRCLKSTLLTVARK